MSQSISILAGHEIASEQLECVGGGFLDKDYNYTSSNDYSGIGNTKTNVEVHQYGSENSATGAGAINTKFG